MTFEKAQAIIDQYGFSVYENSNEKGYYRDGNYCNQWVTDNMTPYTETYDYTADELSFYTGDQFEKIEKYTENNLYFTYQEGWLLLLYCLNMMTLLLVFIVVIAVANVFTEEYSMKTAPILLTTKQGKTKGIWMKILAAITFSSVIYLLLAAIVVIAYCGFYGMDGINGSAAFIGRLEPNSAGLFGSSVGAVILETLLLGLLSVVMSTCITLAVSAICKQPFTSILIGIGILILPYLYVEYINPLLPDVFMVRLLRMVACWLPIYLPVRNVGSQFAIILLFVLAVCVVTGCLGFRRYKNYQETS